MKITSVVGARPQFIKAAIVSPQLVAAGIDDRILHTGQHYDAKMSDAFFDELGIPEPVWSLHVGSGSHGAQTGAMLAKIEETLLADRPDAVLVYGDTNSTTAGALAATKLQIPVVHVEAGLRSFNRAMPEEINRILTDHISDLLLAPTQTAMQHLNAEGLGRDETSHVTLVGDVMYDLALRASENLETADFLATIGVNSGEFVLATVHRAENTDDPVRCAAIIEGLARVARDVPVVLPAHPRTRSLLEADPNSAKLTLIEPVGYLDMVRLEQTCALVATDSGGVQKEAFFHGAPCVTLRDETEWVELVELGWNTVVPPVDATVIHEAIQSRIGTTGEPASPYGHGDAGKRIADAVVARYQ